MAGVVVFVVVLVPVVLVPVVPPVGVVPVVLPLGGGVLGAFAPQATGYSRASLSPELWVIQIEPSLLTVIPAGLPLSVGTLYSSI